MPCASIPQTIYEEPEVITALKMRAADPDSQPHRRSDQYRIAFVAGSGAMAGAITGGMVAALQANGIGARCFDLFVGTSAGAVAAAYYAADQAVEGALIPSERLSSLGYNNDGSGTAYISILRALTGRGYLLDLDGFVDNVIDVDLADVPVPVIALACTAQGELRQLHLSGVSGAEMRQHLKSSMRVPYLSPGDLEDPDMLWDGAYLNVLPLDVAYTHDATHVLALACFPPDVGPELDFLERWLLAPIARLRGHAHIRKLVLGKMESNSRARASAEAVKRGRCFVHELPGATLGQGTTDPAKLWLHMERAYHHTIERFYLPHKDLPPRWQL
jgi:predicted acylesterase/phospholipase RssA